MGILGAFAGLGEAVFRFLAIKGEKDLDKQFTKYADECVELRQKVSDEKARGFDASQAKIEAWEERLIIIAEAAKDAMLARLTAKT